MERLERGAGLAVQMWSGTVGWLCSTVVGSWEGWQRDGSRAREVQAILGRQS